MTLHFLLELRESRDDRCERSWWPGVGALLALAAPALAGEPAQPALNDERLKSVLDMAASQQRQTRINDALVRGALAAVAIPTGVILATESDRGQQIGGVALLINGGWYLFGVALAATPSAMETLRSHYESRKKRGEAPSDVVAATESEWRVTVRSRLPLLDRCESRARYRGNRRGDLFVARRRTKRPGPSS
jgi:hypothetical protein